MRTLIGLLLALVALFSPGIAIGQALSCRVPDTLPAVRPDRPSASDPRRVLPIGGYTLALSWSPEYCRASRARTADPFQCGGPRPRFGFVLHGLWPDGRGAVWPQYCAATGLVPEPTIRGTLCATPSAQLIQHEWAKHGTCMPGETAASYFTRATALYRDVRYPDMAALSRRTGLTVGGFATAFAAANPGLRPDMLRVTTSRGGWLDEVWLCRDLRFRPVRCAARQSGAAPRGRLRIWRGAA